MARSTPLSDNERLIIQNIFDTQPARRQAYLKQLGFEMNPKNDNEYRPIGSPETSYGEIDPGIGAYFKKGGLKEVWNDIKDVGTDLAFKGPAILGGASAGAAGGAAIGAPIGAAAGMPHVGAGVLAMTGAVTGGALGSVVAEEAKKLAGDLILDKSIPQDRALEATQALMDGTFNFAFNGGAALNKAMIRQGLESRQKAIKQALGSGANHEVLTRVANEPELFSPDNAKNGVKNLTGVYRELFGLQDPLSVKRPDQIKEGVFRQVIDPLNEQANSEVKRLGALPQADLTVDEVTAPLKAQIYKITANEFPKEDAREALSYLKKQIKDVERVGAKLQAQRFPSDPNALNKYQNTVRTPNILNAELKTPPSSEIPKSSINSPVGQNRLPFDQAYNLAKKIQEDAFDLEIPGSATLRQIVGNIAPKIPGSEKSSALTGLLAEKSKRFGSSLPEINAKQSKILTAYKSASQNLTPQNIQNAFLSTNKDNVSKQLVRQAAVEMDNVLGTKYSQAIEDGSVQSWVNDVYTNSRDSGSKGIKAAMVKEGAKSAVKGMAGGGAAGAITGIGAVPGAIAGGVAGGIKGATQAAMLANPEAAISAYGKNAVKLAEPTVPFSQAVQNPGIVGAEAAALLAPDHKKEALQNLPVPQSSDPWSILDVPDAQTAPSQQMPGKADPWSILDTP